MLRRYRRFVLRAAWATPLLLLAACQGLIPRGANECGPDSGCAAVVPLHEPRVTREPSLMSLAHDLDHLEKHIDLYGSVVAKSPDVWGQARLTQHREEFDREMAKDLPLFDLRLNGAVSRADASLFTYSQAISVAAAGKPGTPGTAATPQPSLVNSLKLSQGGVAARLNDAGTVTQIVADNGLSIVQTVPQASTPGKSATPATPPTPEIPKDEAKLTAAPTTVLTATAPKSDLASGGISLEPTVELAQKKRYLDFLNQLRRENEGGDTADAPGYQLNLLRIPVSVLPGKHTENGHGAEVTFTIDPVIGDDLLPTTFRRMMVNDLVEQLGLPFTEDLYNTDKQMLLTPESKWAVQVVTRLDDLEASDPKRVSADEALARMRAFARSLTDPQVVSLGRLLPDDMKAKLDTLRYAVVVPITQTGGTTARQLQPPPATQPAPRPVALNQTRTFAVSAMSGEKLRTGSASPATAVASPPAATVSGPKPRKAAEPGGAFQIGTAGSLPFSTGLDNRLPFPTSQLRDVYGDAYLFEISFAIKKALLGDVQYTGYAHLPDVQSLLRNETQSAYQLLAKNKHLLDLFCTPELVQAIRSRNVTEVTYARQAYRDEVAKVTGSAPADPRDEASYKGLPTRQFDLTAALAWGLIVDSALLTDKLLTDLKESATAQGKAPPCPADTWPRFFMPDPPADARQLFADYVRLRWPIHVFALDPMTQEQNLLDSLQTHRETQLALSVAFTSGRIGSRVFTQYARRLQAQYDTVALNRTQVGFAHGQNTFGWRFYPRFQTPPTQSNVTTLFRDQLVGGPSPDALLRQRRMEPGARECVALVIMPSFVPYVTVDAESNWFALANPKNKSLDHSQALRLSRHVRALERCPPGVGDADCYRDGEWQRLQTRVKQLGDRLPSQTMTVPVPIVNTTGGFEMFSNGTTDLAPQLYGFYGAPGVSPGGDTTLFLVGDHFSPLQTKVIVGNKEIVPEKRKMLSRQVMQVTVPTGVLSVTADDGRKWVHAHVATPYGVSREVYIPLDAPPAAPAAPKPGYVIKDGTTLTIRYGTYGEGKSGVFAPVFHGVKPAKITFAWDDPIGLAPAEANVTFLFPYRGTTLKVPCLCKVVAKLNDSREVVLDEATVKAIGCELLRQIRLAGDLPYDNNPLATGLTADKVLITPISQPGQTVAASVDAQGQFKVAFEGQGPCTAKPDDECECPPEEKPMTPPKPPTPMPVK